MGKALEALSAKDTQKVSVHEDGIVRRTGTQECSFLAGQPVPLSDPQLSLSIKKKNKGSC